MKKRILAIPAAATAMPLKPKSAATIAITKKMMAHLSMCSAPFLLSVQQPADTDQNEINGNDEVQKLRDHQNQYSRQNGKYRFDLDEHGLLPSQS